MLAAVGALNGCDGKPLQVNNPARTSSEKAARPSQADEQKWFNALSEEYNNDLGVARVTFNSGAKRGRITTEDIKVIIHDYEDAFRCATEAYNSPVRASGNSWAKAFPGAVYVVHRNVHPAWAEIRFSTTDQELYDLLTEGESGELEKVLKENGYLVSVDPVPEEWQIE